MRVRSETALGVRSLFEPYTFNPLSKRITVSKQWIHMYKNKELNTKRTPTTRPWVHNIRPTGRMQAARPLLTAEADGVVSATMSPALLATTMVSCVAGWLQIAASNRWLKLEMALTALWILHPEADHRKSFENFVAPERPILFQWTLLWTAPFLKCRHFRILRLGICCFTIFELLKNVQKPL